MKSTPLKSSEEEIVPINVSENAAFLSKPASIEDLLQRASFERIPPHQSRLASTDAPLSQSAWNASS
jgi:hypothetical protein